ncbi:hypothetical protein [Paenibacillus naphthalenovorans]|uniref:Uncharacterized protein n=1 Tax=Paenibacillus naphthalenovorans TaxID=162209 RepID=A0A0U2VEX6_9BACL|nr:hypothetical protein [Paenibacillus naphthalenovorans]ALS22083.1 hypothetical protein IJ22_17090 [Paenibacillus naphthalenovorans]
MDRFEYRDEGESPEEFSTCANENCRKTLYIGDEILEHYGLVCCRNINCLIAITETKEMIAENDEE